MDSAAQPGPVNELGSILVVSQGDMDPTKGLC